MNSTGIACGMLSVRGVVIDNNQTLTAALVRMAACRTSVAWYELYEARIGRRDWVDEPKTTELGWKSKQIMLSNKYFMVKQAGGQGKPAEWHFVVE